MPEDFSHIHQQFAILRRARDLAFRVTGQECRGRNLPSGPVTEKKKGGHLAAAARVVASEAAGLDPAASMPLALPEETEQRLRLLVRDSDGLYAQLLANLVR